MCGKAGSPPQGSVVMMAQKVHGEVARMGEAA
jgi:hypothetical protein